VFRWRVTEAANADEAIEKAENAEAPFDMVLTDMVMPGMDGRELASLLRKRWPDLPIVLMTGYDSGVAGSALGERDYVLTKPFSSSDLASMLQRARTNSDD
jgi:CheY-like chemotaxis protein